MYLDEQSSGLLLSGAEVVDLIAALFEAARLAFPAIREVPAEQAVLDAVREPANGRVLGAHTEIRRAEIAAVHTKDLICDPDGWSLVMHGKGSQEHIEPLLPEFAAIIRKAQPGWVFPNGMGGHLTPAHVGVLHAAAQAAGRRGA